MRILIAPDKFKHSLGALEVAEQIASGLREVLPAAEITCLPIADGGEGTAEVICAARRGRWHDVEVHDALGRLISARYGLLPDASGAVMEMSAAAGLWRLRPDERDPLAASSAGVGEMLLHAVEREVREIVIGLGGSATNDGGFGMARALGFRFFDRRDAELSGNVSELLALTRIEQPRVLLLPPITAAVDVRNPLLGDRGATRTFAAQKGANAEQIELLEDSLGNLAEVVSRDFGCDFRDEPGAGAAGGLGFALRTFCGAQLRSGFEVVAEAIGLREKINASDLVITGEGRLDAQTREGKAPAGVAQMAQAAGKPVFAIVGSVADDADSMFDRVFALTNGAAGETNAMTNAPALLRARARELAETIR